MVGSAHYTSGAPICSELDPLHISLDPQGGQYTQCTTRQYTKPSSRGSPIIWNFRNGYEYHSPIVPCPIRHPSLTPQFPIILYTRFSTCCSVFIYVSFLVGLLVRLPVFAPSALRHFSLTCQHHFSLFSRIFFVTGATFTYPLTRSFLILSKTNLSYISLEH